MHNSFSKIEVTLLGTTNTGEHRLTERELRLENFTFLLHSYLKLGLATYKIKDCNLGSLRLV